VGLAAARACAAGRARPARRPGARGGARRTVPGRLVPDAAAGRAVRGSGRAQRRRGLPARPDDSAPGVVGVRLAAVVPLDPRVAQSGVLVDHAHLLHRLLRDLMRLAPRLVAQGAARRRAAHDLRRDDHVLSLLRRVPLLSGRRAALRLRPRAQRRHGDLAGACHPVAARPRGLLGRGLPVVARRRRRRRHDLRAALLAPPRAGARAADPRPGPLGSVRAVPLRGGRGVGSVRGRRRARVPVRLRRGAGEGRRATSGGEPGAGLRRADPLAARHRGPTPRQKYAVASWNPDAGRPQRPRLAAREATVSRSPPSPSIRRWNWRSISNKPTTYAARFTTNTIVKSSGYGSQIPK